MLPIGTRGRSLVWLPLFCVGPLRSCVFLISKIKKMWKTSRRRESAAPPGPNHRSTETPAIVTASPAAAGALQGSIEFLRWATLAILGVSLFLPSESVATSGIGVPVVILWLLLAAAAGVRGISVWQNTNRLPDGVSDPVAPRFIWHGVDICVVVFCLWHTTSAWVGIATASIEVRPAIFLMWQQISMLVVYGLARTCFHSPATRTWLASGAVGLALTVALFAWFQYLIVLPELQQTYRAASETERIEMLSQGGISDVEAGSRMRELYESRLFNREPMGLFALANSLAGLLVPWTITAVVMLVESLFPRTGGGTRFGSGALWFIAWAILAGALILTSSRSGVLAVLVIGILFLAHHLVIARWWNRRTQPLLLADTAPSDSPPNPSWMQRWVIPVLVLLPLLVLGGLWASGQSDSRLLSSAPASLRYRLEYWVATLDLISASPWFGCGPGNFQAAFAAFQLPQASETVSDPHNLFLEFAATAGLPAGLAFTAALLWVGLIAFGWNAPVHPRRDAPGGVPTERVSMEPADVLPRGDWLGAAASLIVCLAAAVFLAYAISFVYGVAIDRMVPLMICAAVASVWMVLSLWQYRNNKETSRPRATSPPSSAANPAPAMDPLDAAQASSDATTDLGRPGQNGGAARGSHSVWPRWALAAMVVHLCASGGVNFPAIGQWIFLLAGLCVAQHSVIRQVAKSRALADSQSLSNVRSVARSRTRNVSAHRPRPAWVLWGSAAMIVVPLGLSVRAYFFDLLPVVQAEIALERAEENLRSGNWQAADRFFQKAIEQDPLQAEAKLQLAILNLIRNLPDIDQAATQTRTEDAFRSAGAARPASAPLRLRMAEAYLNAAWQTGNRSAPPPSSGVEPARSSPDSASATSERYLLAQAEFWLNQAIERKPVDARVWVQQAWVQWMQGDPQRARELSDRAADLDAQMPHADLKLNRQSIIAWDQQRRPFAGPSPAESTPPPAPTSDAALSLNKLRSWEKW